MDILNLALNLLIGMGLFILGAFLGIKDCKQTYSIPKGVTPEFVHNAIDNYKEVSNG